MVPDGWREVTIEDCLEDKNSMAYGILQPGDDVENGIPMIRTVDIGEDGLCGTKIIKVSPALHEEYKRTALSGGEVLLSVMGTVGRTMVVPKECHGWNVNRALAVMRLNSQTDPFYFSAYIKSPFINDRLIEQAIGSAQKRINLGDLKKYKVRMPPLPEQKKIAKIVSAWDKAIATTEQLLVNSQQQKKALMQQLLTGKQRLLDQNGERFESKWREVELGSVLKEVKRPVDWDDAADYKLLSVKRRSEGVVLREVLKGTEILTKKMNIAQSGDFLISKMQIVHGAAGLVPDEFDGFHISDSYISLTPKDERKLDIHFFAWFAKQKLMYHKAFLCSYGVHIEKMTFNFKLFLKEKISVPASIEEQQKIAAVLSTADQEISALQQKLDALKQEKKALMQQLLTGKRRVPLN